MVDVKPVVKTAECNEKESVEMGAGVVERPATQMVSTQTPALAPGGAGG